MIRNRTMRIVTTVIVTAALLAVDISPVLAASTVKLSKQQIKLERVFNFRDLGGYKTKTGKHVKRNVLFRSGELTYATEKDIDTLDDMNISKVIDFRYNADRKYAADKKIPGASYVKVRIKKDKNTSVSKAKKRKKRFTKLSQNAGRQKFMGTFASTRRAVVRHNTYNLVMGKSCQKNYKKYFKHLLANKDGDPILMHCIAGKDRTGIAAFMTLIALGVDEKTAMKEYALTNSFYTSVKCASYGKVKNGVKVKDLKYATKKLKKKYGSYKKFFKNCYGLSKSDLKKLRKIYLQ